MTQQSVLDNPESIRIHICHRTDWEAEMGCSQAAMDALQEEYRDEHYKESAAQEYFELGQAHLSQEQPGLDDSWPWYLDQPWDIQEPEILEI